MTTGTITDDELASIARSRQQQIREGLSSWRKRLAAEGREYPNLDEAVYAQAVAEAFLRGVSRHPVLSKQWLLKGGRLSAVYDKTPVPERPTLDLDLQRLVLDPEAATRLHSLSQEESLRQFVAEVRSIVEDERFVRETGMVFDLANMTTSPVRDGVLSDAWRIEGFVHLGVPGAKGTPRVKFVLELTTGPAPEAAYTVADHPAFLNGGEPFAILIARPEWQVAEKLHAIVSRPDNNSRYKDWYDLIRLARRGGIDTDRMQACLQHVFIDEFGGRDPLPSRCSDASGLTAGRATDIHEKAWQTGVYAKLTGRAFDLDRDPSYVALVGATCSALERMGAVAEVPPAADAARALADVVELSRGDMDANGAPERFADAFGRLVDAAARATREDIAFRTLGEMHFRNLRPGAGPAALLDEAFNKLREAGVCARVPGAADLKRRFAAVADRLNAEHPAPRFVASAAPKAQAASPAGEKPDGGRSGRPAPTASEVAKILSKIVPGGRDTKALNAWLTDLTFAARAVEAGVAIDRVEIADCPAPGIAVAGRIWSSMAKSQGIGMALEEVLAAVRPGAPAPGM